MAEEVFQIANWWGYSGNEMDILGNNNSPEWQKISFRNNRDSQKDLLADK